MSRSDTLSSGKPRLSHRLRARRAAFWHPKTRFFGDPEPYSIGLSVRGTQLAAGTFRFAGTTVNTPETDVWDITAPSDQFAAALHGWTWLDDLMASDSRRAYQLARDWPMMWLNRYAGGRGPGWAPDIIGRRLVRMVNHAGHVLYDQPDHIRDTYLRSVAQQVILLSHLAHRAPQGYAEVEALTGLLHAGYALSDMEEYTDPAIPLIGKAASKLVDDQGAIASRNAEELLDLFELVTWAHTAITGTGKTPTREHLAVLDRLATALRGLRHTDGGLPRFHGGGRGDPGRIDQALLTSGAEFHMPPEQVMGYARLKAGRTSIITDVALPPAQAAAETAHASSLAFEMTVGRRPMIVNCGCGRMHDPDLRRAGRATPSQSTLGLDGYSSSRLDPTLHRLTEIPSVVRAKLSREQGVKQLEGFHDGYRNSHGLVHIRKLRLNAAGTKLTGEEILSTTTPRDRHAFDNMIAKSPEEGLGVSVRFHLHPDVTPQHDKRRDLVYLSLINGDTWIFRHDGMVSLWLEPSIYLDGRQLEPRATKQVVLSGLVLDYAGRVSWSLAKSQDAPTAIRDYRPSDSLTI